MVPRLLQRMYDVIQKKSEEANCFSQWLLGLALDAKMSGLKTDGTVTNGFWDGIVFNKMAQVLGGNVKIMVTGSAPIDSEILQKLKC